MSFASMHNDYLDPDRHLWQDEEPDDNGNDIDPDEDLDFDGSRLEFANPGSALRCGDRIHPCPTCGEPHRLTAKDRQLGYQCDDCADRAEGRGY